MNTPASIDGLLVQWGDRLFYPANRRTPAGPGGLRSAGLHDRAARVRARARIAATVARRAPQVMVKVTGGGRGMGAISAHFRYISKGGRLAFEDDRGVVRDGKAALRDPADQWRRAGTRILEHSERREALNIMLSMPAGTNAEIVRSAARAFARAELSGHRYVMVLRTHQANPHVHLSVRAEGRDGRRWPCARSPRRLHRPMTRRTTGWGSRSSTLRAGCRPCDSGRTRSSRNGSCRGWNARLSRRHGPSRGGSAESFAGD